MKDTHNIYFRSLHSLRFRIILHHVHWLFDQHEEVETEHKHKHHRLQNQEALSLCEKHFHSSRTTNRKHFSLHFSSSSSISFYTFFAMLRWLLTCERFALTITSLHSTHCCHLENWISVNGGTSANAHRQFLYPSLRLVSRRRSSFLKRLQEVNLPKFFPLLVSAVSANHKDRNRCGRDNETEWRRLMTEELSRLFNIRLSHQTNDWDLKILLSRTQAPRRGWKLIKETFLLLSCTLILTPFEGVLPSASFFEENLC